MIKSNPINIIVIIGKYLVLAGHSNLTSISVKALAVKWHRTKSSMVKRLKKQVNDNIRDRNFKPVNQYTVTAIKILKVAINLFRVMPCFNNLEVRS